MRYYKVKDEYNGIEMKRSCWDGRKHRGAVLDKTVLYTQREMEKFSKGFVLEINDKKVNLADIFEPVEISKNDTCVIFGKRYKGG